jgi:hypothetical protein
VAISTGRPSRLACSSVSPAQAISVKPGENVAELLLPPVAAATRAVVRLLVGDRVLDQRTIERQPVRKWEIHLIHQTHLDIGFTHTQEEVLRLQVGFLYKALELIEQTRDYPEDAKFKWHGTRGASEIVYCDFGDLSSIIVTNWAQFESILSDMEWSKAVLNTLERSRNIVMHGGLLSKEDVERIGMNIRDWIRQAG